jgi:hypothetical protein
MCGTKLSRCVDASLTAAAPTLVLEITRLIVVVGVTVRIESSGLWTEIQRLPKLGPERDDAHLAGTFLHPGCGAPVYLLL